jgi:hypothetical protein
LSRAKPVCGNRRSSPAIGCYVDDQEGRSSRSGLEMVARVYRRK